MVISRRAFLRAAAGLAGAVALPWELSARGEGGASGLATPGVWPILQGHTDLTGTSLLVLHPRQIPFAALAFRGEESLTAAKVEEFALPGSALVVSEFYVGGLVPGVDHRFELRAEDGRVLDQRLFRALDVSRAACRFGLASCMNDTLGSSRAMWTGLAQEGCDLVFLVGDTCYADVKNPSRGTESGYAARYAETRLNLEWFRTERLTPTYATWDDHDFGLNNGDKSFPLAPFTRQLFRAFWGRREGGGWRKAHGVGSVLRACGQRFFLMDDRSFRDAPDRGGRHWGSAQTDWLLGELASSREPAWLLNGSQFFGGYFEKESFEGNFPQDFRALLGALRTIEAPVAFVSGDVHFSELMRIEPAQLGYETIELTSSSIHSYNFPYIDRQARNPRRVVSEWRHNFLVVDSRVNGSSAWEGEVRCVTADRNRAFARSFSIVR